MAVITLCFSLVGCGSDDDDKKKDRDKEKAEQKQTLRSPEELAMFRVHQRFAQVNAQMNQIEKDLQLQKAHHDALRNELESIYRDLQSAELRGFRFGDINTTEMLAIQARERELRESERRREEMRDSKEDREEDENRVLTTVIILLLLLSIVVFFAKILMDRKNQAPSYPVTPRDVNDSTTVEPSANNQDPLRQPDDPNATPPPLT